MGINPDTKSRDELEFLKTVGNGLAFYRGEKKLSQKDVAKQMQELGMERFAKLHLFEIENGKANTGLYETALLCNLYGISIDDVLQKWKDYKGRGIPPYQKTNFSELKTEAALKHRINQLDQTLEKIYNIYRIR